MKSAAAVSGIPIILIVVLGVFLLRWFATRVRRTQLRGTLAAFPAMLQGPAGEWIDGTIRYGEDELHWYRDASVTPIPEVKLPRHLLEMKRQAADSAASGSLRASQAGHDWVVVDFSTPVREAPVTLAMGFGQSAGICAWIEAWGTVGRGHWR